MDTDIRLAQRHGPGDLEVGAEAEILWRQIEAQAWEASVLSWLQEMRLSLGDSAIDLGCGAVGILALLSRLVGPSGRVVGLDSDPDQLAAVHDLVAGRREANIEILEGDVYAVPQTGDSFDLVHVRFLSAGGARYCDLLSEMVRLARPGGIVAVQEPIVDTWRCFPPHPAWDTLREIILAGWQQTGVDLNAGQRVFGLMRDVGLRDVRVRAAILALQNDAAYRWLPLQFATSLRENIIGAGLLSPGDFDSLLDECKALLARPDTFVLTFSLIQTYGRKQAS